MPRRAFSFGPQPPLFELAVGSLGLTVETLPTGKARGMTGAHKVTRKQFAAAPDALIVSWDAARQLDRVVGDGDEVYISDRAGVAGVFALDRLGTGTRVVVVAGDGIVARQLSLYGTLVDINEPTAATIDWELTALRYADEVISPAPAVCSLLASFGISAGLIELVPEEAGTTPVVPPYRLPEPFGRVGRGPDILRAFMGALDHVVVSEEDVADVVWGGTTWDANADLRRVLGDQVSRGTGGATHILGDRLGLPPSATDRHVAGGGAVIVAAGSVATQRWPSAPAWNTSDDLAHILDGGPGVEPLVLSVPASRRPDPARAHRVSVGVPVFGDASHLAECITSIQAQTQPPHEVLVYDDGSNSADVDATLAALDSVTVMRGPNRGVCVARNRMLEAMTGDAFVFVDADDVLAPSFIEACSRRLRADVSLTAVATWTEFFGGYEAIEPKPPFDARTGTRENTIVSTCVLVDMAVREQGVRFAPDLAFLYCEDWDLWGQIVGNGGRFGLVPEPLARHRVHRASGGFKRQPIATEIGKARAIAHFS